MNLRQANEESKLIDFEGWEHVIIERDGARFRLKIHDHPIVGGYMVLLKKTVGNLNSFVANRRVEEKAIAERITNKTVMCDSLN